jgi:hypothetical protein
MKALVIIEEGFNKITEIIEGLMEAMGKPPSDLYHKLEKSQKGASDGHLWNIYLHYFTLRVSMSLGHPQVPVGLPMGNPQVK